MPITIRILLLIFASSIIACSENAPKGESCTIIKGDDGPVLRCPDGTEAPLPKAEATCHIEDRGKGVQAVVCQDGAELIVQEPVTCSVSENPAGYSEVVCSDGTEGALCKVTSNDQSISLTCGENSVNVPAGCSVYQYTYKSHNAYTLSCNNEPPTLLTLVQKKMLLGERRIDVGTSHTCGIRSNGYALCWGDSGYGQRATPATEKFVDIAAGHHHSCGLRENGEVICWGENDYGQRDVPPSTLFVHLSAKGDFTCGLTNLGNATCWGEGGVTTTTGPFVQLSSGIYHSCGLKYDGTINCWGDNAYGRATPPEGELYIQIAAGGSHTCGLRPDGTGICWGNPANSRLNIPAASRYVELVAGGPFSGAIEIDRSVKFWGDSWNFPVAGKFSALAAATYHSCALTTTGAMCWGNNSWGQTTVPVEFQ